KSASGVDSSQRVRGDRREARWATVEFPIEKRWRIHPAPLRERRLEREHNRCAAFGGEASVRARSAPHQKRARQPRETRCASPGTGETTLADPCASRVLTLRRRASRSEERRVGKEGGSRKTVRL